MCVKLANPNSNGQMLAKRRYNKAGGYNIIEGERGGKTMLVFLLIFSSSNIFMTHPPIAIHKIHIKMCVLVANHCELKTFLSLSITTCNRITVVFKSNKNKTIGKVLIISIK